MDTVVLLIVCAFTVVSGQSGTVWTPHPGNPIISGPTPTSVSNFRFWNDPTVIKDGPNAYRMWLTTTRNPNSFEPPVEPYFATSTNGIDWNINSSPALEVGGPGSIDEKLNETPTVVYYNGMYHMYYTAEPDNSALPTNPFPWFIGHAWSVDGADGTWTKDPEPVVGIDQGSDSWRFSLVAEPGAVVFNGQVYLYFIGYQTASDYPFGKFTMGLGISNDGFNFTEPIPVMDNYNSTGFPRSEGYYGYSTPAPTVLNGQIHIYHGVYQNVGGEFLQVAVTHSYSNSSDGLTNYITDNSAIFVREDFYFTADEIRAATVIESGEVLEMYFAGQNLLLLEPPYTNWSIGIGYATSPNPFYQPTTTATTTAETTGATGSSTTESESIQPTSAETTDVSSNSSAGMTHSPALATLLSLMLGIAVLQGYC